MLIKPVRIDKHLTWWNHGMATVAILSIRLRETTPDDHFDQGTAMPLRDHFHPPLGALQTWEGLYGYWPTEIVRRLFPLLPEGYTAEPRIHLAAASEHDATTCAGGRGRSALPEAEDRVVVATPAWDPPTLSVATDLGDLDVYEVRVLDRRSGRRLAAVVELVSPGNLDRPGNRRAFEARCASLLQGRVSVVIVDVVTDCWANLYVELLSLFGVDDPAMGGDPSPTCATACRWIDRGGGRLEAWAVAPEPGRPLPELPPWLAEDRVIPLDLEARYEESCRILRIP